MAGEQLPVNASTLDLKTLVKELEVPFSPNQVQWRVTSTAKDRKRGQVVPYADPRAYADRLNALFTPQGWTREYRVETLGNITRIKGGESIVTGKILVTCTVTIIGLSSHSGTGGMGREGRSRTDERQDRVPIWQMNWILGLPR